MINFKHLRKMHCGMTQSELAKMVGVSRGYICYIERGKMRPSEELAQKIAEILEFDWKLFFDTDVRD